MKINISPSTLRTLKNLEGLWLLRNHQIMIIKDFKYETDKPQEQPVEPNTVIVKKKRFGKKDREPKIYLTEITLVGYNSDLKFMGTFNDEFCSNIIWMHENSESNLIDYRKKWMAMEEQIQAFKAQENN